MYGATKVLDVHGHVSVPAAANAYLALLLASNTAMPSPLSSGRGGASEEEYRQAAARHVAYLDERNIDVQLIGPRPFMELGWMEPHLFRAWTHHVNETIAQQVRFHPDRFVGAAQLPIDSDAPDTTHVLAELDRCVDQLGFAAAYLAPDPKGERTTPGVHEAYWYPLYERCEDGQIPLIVHGTNTKDRRMAVVPHNYQLGFVLEQYLATQFFMHSDVFDRFPRLKVIVCHCGGALDRFMRSDPHVGQRDLADNLFFDTCAHDIDYLTAAIKQRTVPQVVFGTEAPGSGAAPRPAGEPGISGDDLVPVIGSLDFLSDEEKVRIFYDNPARVVPQLAKV